MLVQYFHPSPLVSLRHILFLLQVKTNEYRKPWDENNDEQHIDKKNLSKAKDQLMRDVLRFSELLPDLKFSEKIHFKTFVAFPLVEEEIFEMRNDCDILTKPSLQSNEKLQSKLGLQMNSLLTEKCIFKTIVGRYVGLHSTIPLKKRAQAFHCEEKVHKRSIKEFDSAIQHSGSFQEIPDFGCSHEGLRTKMSSNKISRDILSAINNKNYRFGKFREQYSFPDFAQTNVFEFKESGKEDLYPIRRTSSKNHVVIGKKNIILLLQHHDSKLGHQGLGEIVKRIKKSKVEFLDSKTEDSHKKQKEYFEIPQSNLEENLLDYFQCEQCEFVKMLKGKGDFDGYQVNLTEPRYIQDAIQYGDRLHKGI